MKIPPALERVSFLLKRDARKLFFPFRWQKKAAISHEKIKFSAYLSVYNDWDLLAPALLSIASYVDELVVVDGAYEWMVPYLEAIGSDPLRSDARVYAALDASGIHYRTINGTWKNEAEKRVAGYEACIHRYVYRIDADEVLFFNDEALDAFLGSGCAVAEMQIPLYAAPGWIIRSTGLRGLVRKIPSALCLFDTKKISASTHLKYLWLVLAGESPAPQDDSTFAVFERPIAFCAHLSSWRTPETAVNRAVFYMLNWMRHHKVSWLPVPNGFSRGDFELVFRSIPALRIRNALKRAKISLGTIDLSPGEALARSPLSSTQERVFAGLHEFFLDGLATQNQEVTSQQQTLIFGEPVFLDISTQAARSALSADGTVTITTTVPLASLTLRIHSVVTISPFCVVEDLPHVITGRNFSFELPAVPPSDKRLLRQAVEFVGYFGEGGAGRGFCEFIVNTPS